MPDQLLARRGPLNWSVASVHVQLLPLSRIDERFWACRPKSRATGLELLDLPPQFVCGVLGPSVAHRGDSVTTVPPSAHAVTVVHGRDPRILETGTTKKVGGVRRPGIIPKVEISAQQRPQTSPKVAQLIVSSEFTVI